MAGFTGSGGFGGGGGKGFTTGGATGADEYYSRRFETYAKYLTGTASPDLVANLATSDTLFDGSVRALNARMSNQYSLSQLVHYAQERRVPAIPIEKIGELKSYLKQRGWVHPDTPINEYWGPGDPFYDVANHAKDWEYDHPEAAPRPGVIESHGIFKWLSDLQPSRVWQGLLGMGRQIVADIGNVTNIKPLMELNPEWAKNMETQEKAVAEVQRRVTEKEATGEIYTYRNFMEDFNLKKLDLFWRKDITLNSPAIDLDRPIDERDWLRGGGTEDFARRQFPVTSLAEDLFSALNFATLGVETGIARRAVDPALKTLGQQWAKGGLEQAFRVIPDELTQTMSRSLMNRVVTFTTGKMGWEGGAAMFQTVAKPLWTFKSTATGKLITSGLTAATQVSVTARARGAIESGYIFPGVNPLGLRQSQLSRAIDAAPVLGQGIAFGPAGEDRWLGNAIDLTGFIWSPTSFLPVKFSQIRNGVMNMVGRNELAPLQQLFKIGRKDLIENLGGEAATTTFMRYLKVQAHLENTAHAAAVDAGKGGDGPFVREAIFRESERITKAGPEAIEEAIRAATPEMVAKTSLRIFGDGMAGDPVAWGRAHQILRGVEEDGLLTIREMLDEAGNPLVDDVGNIVTTPLVTVDDFRSLSGRKTGTGVWGAANKEALDDIGRRIHEATSPARAPAGPAIFGTVERKLMQSNLSAAKRLGEQLTGDERLIFTRANKPLSTAQSFNQWFALTARLRRVFPRLKAVVDEPNPILFKYGYEDFPQLLDLKAAGFSDNEIQQMRMASQTVGQGVGPIPAAQAAMGPPSPTFEEKMLAIGKGITPGQQQFPVLGTAKVKTPITFDKSDIYMTPEQAARFHQSVDRQLVELGQRLVDNHPQFAALIQNADQHVVLTRGARKQLRQYAATLPRAVTIHDANIQSQIHALGYEPAIANRNMITLRDVGTGLIEQELGRASHLQPVMDMLGLGDVEVRQKVLQTVMKNHLESELESVRLASGGIAGEISGEGMHNTLKDIARRAEAKRSKFYVNGRPAWKAGQIFDLRSLTVKEIQELGFGRANAETRRAALEIQGAIRRGYAYGGVADIRHPLQTAKAAGEMFMVRGLPGIEDLLRTLGSTGGNMKKLPPGLAPILRLPDKLVRARDFVQFGLNPLFTLQNAMETMQMRAFYGVPHTMPFRAEAFVAEFSSANPERFAEIMAAAFGDARGALYSQHGHDDLYQLVDRGFFGLNLRANEMADAIKLAERGEDLSTIGKKVERIYRYGPGLRSPIMQTINYVFFPFSFNMKYTAAAIGWMNQKPARALAIHTGMAAMNKLREDGKLDEWVEQHAPILTELNRLNTLSRGLSAGTSPIGGRNRRVYDAWNAAKVLLSGMGAGIAPFVPMAVSEADRKDAAAVIKRAIPAIKQAQDFWKSSVSQAHAITEGGADEWQVSNYMEAKRDLDDEIRADMTAIGLTSGRDSVGTKAMVAAYGGVEQAQAYAQWIIDQEAEMARKYPQGQIFSNRYIADSVKKSQELGSLAEQAYKTPAENAILWFASEVAREEMFADIAARQVTMTTRQKTNLKLEVAAAAAKGLPVADIPGELTQDQMQGLRSQAVRLAATYPEFTWLYDRYFHNQFGAIDVRQPVAAGVAP